MRTLGCLLLLSSLGCGSGMTAALVRRGAVSMSCPRQELSVRPSPVAGPDVYQLSGCGRSVLFHCREGRCESLRPSARPGTWSQDAVEGALRGVNAAVLACVPGRQEISLEVHLSARGHADRGVAWDVPVVERNCIRRALGRVRLRNPVESGRLVTFVFGGASLSGLGPPPPFVAPQPSAASPSLETVPEPPQEDR